MSDPYQNTNWKELIGQVLSWEQWTPEQLAQKILIPVETLHQWLEGSSEPTLDGKLRIEQVAQGLSIASLIGYVEIVRQSPFPMIIVDSRDNVLVASRSSRMIAGKKLHDQLADDVMDHYRKYLEQLSGSSFWKKGGQEHNFRFEARARLVEAVVTSIEVRTGVYLVAQKKIW